MADVLGFHEMGLDDRILKAIAKLKWAQPTPIQEQAIPLALEGKDILTRAKTGSGKTGAFVIPIVQKILQSKQTAIEQSVKAIVMTPSTDLCNQAQKNIKEIICCCSRAVRSVDISPKVPLATQRPLLMEQPDIVVGTPTRILAHIKEGNLAVKESLEMLVIDEADLVLSFGYELDIKVLLKHFPKTYQAFLMSATLNEEVQALKKMVLHNAAILKLEDNQIPDASQLEQYLIKCEEEDKFSLIYALLKLRLIQGRTLMFVNSVNQSYRLKLLLEQFGISSCILNSELPVASRCQIVNQFNKGICDYLIASDEIVFSKSDNISNKGKKKNTKKVKKDTEYGVSRGIDFYNVSNVVNFDFPSSVIGYIHRIGRTARANNRGTALSLVSMTEMPFLEKVEKALTDTASDGKSVFKQYKFRMEEIEGFRYRAKDALRTITRKVIVEARLKEIRHELLNSQKLKTYFADNPIDKKVLRHDKNLHIIKRKSVFDHIPDYLVPAALRKAVRRDQTRQSRADLKRDRSNFKKRKADPLKNFKFDGLRTKKRRLF